MTTSTCLPSDATRTDYTALAIALVEAPDQGVCPALKAALQDACVEAGAPFAGLGWATLNTLLRLSGRKVGRKAITSWLAGEVKAGAASVYDDRQARLTHPDGGFDGAGRWYPSDSEECGDIKGVIRSPSRAWPNTYNRACRSRKHCVTLVEYGVLGCRSPRDVQHTAARIRSELLNHLKGV